MFMTEENKKTIFKLEDKLKDFLDVVCKDEMEREVYSLQIAWDMILCSCPYDKEEDFTMVSKEILKGRLDLLSQQANEFILMNKNKK